MGLLVAYTIDVVFASKFKIVLHQDYVAKGLTYEMKCLAFKCLGLVDHSWPLPCSLPVHLHAYTL